MAQTTFVNQPRVLPCRVLTPRRSAVRAHDGKGHRVVGIGRSADHSGQDATEDREDHQLSHRAHEEGHVGEAVARQHVPLVVRCLVDRTSSQLLFALLDLWEITCEARERRRPECKRTLVADQAEDVERRAGLPLGRAGHAQPAKAYTPCQERERRRDMWTPGAIVCKRADNEEEHGLDGKRQPVGDEHNRVDWSLASCARFYIYQTLTGPLAAIRDEAAVSGTAWRAATGNGRVPAREVEQVLPGANGKVEGACARGIRTCCSRG